MEAMMKTGNGLMHIFTYLIAKHERCAALPAVWGRIQCNFSQFFLNPVNKTLVRSIHNIKS